MENKKVKKIVNILRSDIKKQVKKEIKSQLSNIIKEVLEKKTKKLVREEIQYALSLTGQSNTNTVNNSNKVNNEVNEVNNNKTNQNNINNNNSNGKLSSASTKVNSIMEQLYRDNRKADSNTKVDPSEINPDNPGVKAQMKDYSDLMKKLDEKS